MLPFSYARPNTLDEAVRLLTQQQARVLAGGTDLTVGLRNGRIRPELVVDIKQVAELEPSIYHDAEHVYISATTSLTKVVDHPTVQRHLPCLAAGADVVGSLQIRHRATLVGNICNASPAADTVPVLAMYGASLTITGPSGQRQALVSEFVQGNRRIDLKLGELVTAVVIPLPTGPSGAAFERMTRRRGVDLATINVSCLVEEEATTIALGAVAPVPVIFRDTSGELRPRPDGTVSAVAVEKVVARAAPISDVRANSEYRHAMVRVLLRRALHRAHIKFIEMEKSQ